MTVSRHDEFAQRGVRGAPLAPGVQKTTGALNGAAPEDPETRVMRPAIGVQMDRTHLRRSTLRSLALFPVKGLHPCMRRGQAEPRTYTMKGSWSRLPWKSLLSEHAPDKSV